ncbi:PAS domain-containing protein [Microvirga pudoricolor]|uniref:PAS domain-containing protein n=1 Tax=Microvirga pudoricolor TaxID=2778729 RepID=UPI00194E9564|nr:PAS domain-containing protein [Microvirga pudoricolor]MBM6593168.1 PAS domain-containing protein [Microvirga pudoricolor]
MHQDEVEAVARAFYYTNENARGWHLEPERLKLSFLEKAKAAVTAIEDFRPPLPVRQNLENGEERSPADKLAERLRLAPAKFIAVLTGPRHVFHMANHPYRHLVGRRALTGRPVREAFPEVEGQGFFELLDRVYETGDAFTGIRLPFLVQARRGRPPEQRLINLTYKPITSESSDRLGILVEGRDVTGLIAVP